MKKSTSISSVLFLALCSVLAVSCSKKNESKEVSEKKIELEKSSHTWFYFQENRLNEISRIADVPSFPKKPWTEAVRISSSGCVPDNDDNANSQKAYAIVNRLGIIEFSDEDLNLIKDQTFFKGKAAGNLVFWANTPIFSVYKSTFFGESLVSSNGPHTFLLQFNPKTKMIIPVLNVENLCSLPSEAENSKNIEITDFIWDGNVWSVCKKESDNTKVNFSYMTFQPKEEITSINPNNADEMIYKSEISEQTFRSLETPLDFSKAPERIENLLDSLKKTTDFTLCLSTAGSQSPRNYINHATETDSPAVGYATLSDSWCAALFQDGTLFLNGALSRNRIINKGKTIAFKLPKLPDGFEYSGFVFSGKTLYAFWEETEFYKTGRSGLVRVLLDPIISSFED